MTKYEKVTNKLLKTGLFDHVHQCGYPTWGNPVNLLCKAKNGKTLYVTQDVNRWCIDYADKDIARKEMSHIADIRTQFGMIKRVKAIANA